MEYRMFGRTGLRVSLAGLGTGGASRLGQDTGRSAAESHQVVHRALELGINLFDTSIAYGGSEALLGEALKGVPRDSYVLTTKFQPVGGGVVRTAEEVTQQLETSLTALQTDYVDVWQYHGLGPQDYRAVIDRQHEAVLKAQQQGKVRFIGVTETVAKDPHHEMLEVALTEDLFDTLMIKYGILNQSGAERVLPLARERNVGVMVMASVRTSLRNPKEAVSFIMRFIDEGSLKLPRPSEADPLGLGSTGDPVPGLTQAAYQFAAENPAVSSVLIGTGNSAHLSANVAEMFAPGLTARQMDYLRRAYAGLDWTA